MTARHTTAPARRATVPDRVAGEEVLAWLRAEFPDWGFVFDGHRWWAVHGRRILVHGTDPALLRTHLMDVHGQRGSSAAGSEPVVPAVWWAPREPVSQPAPAGRSRDGRATYHGVHVRASRHAGDGT